MLWRPLTGISQVFGKEDETRGMNENASDNDNEQQSTACLH